jgi:hypothetical protein
MDLKALYGDKDSLTIEELQAAIGERKLVDLSEGGYVAKAKYDADTAKATKDARDAKNALDEAKAKTDGDGGLNAQLADLTAKFEAAEKARLEASDKLAKKERLELATSKIGDKKLARLAAIDAEALVSDDLDYAAALDKVIADDPDYAKNDNDDTHKPSIRLRTGTEGGHSTAKVDPEVAGFYAGLGELADDD